MPGAPPLADWWMSIGLPYFCEARRACGPSQCTTLPDVLPSGGGLHTSCSIMCMSIAASCGYAALVVRGTTQLSSSSCMLRLRSCCACSSLLERSDPCGGLLLQLPCGADLCQQREAAEVDKGLHQPWRGRQRPGQAAGRSLQTAGMPHLSWSVSVWQQDNCSTGRCLQTADMSHMCTACVCMATTSLLSASEAFPLPIWCENISICRIYNGLHIAGDAAVFDAGHPGQCWRIDK